MNRIKRFFFPQITTKYLIRLIAIAGIAYLIFGYILIPFQIKGQSMEPTYRDGQFNFCFHPYYLFTKPETGDIVTIRYAGKHIMLLKRIVALEGQTVAFKDGTLYVDGIAQAEFYVKTSCNWQLPVRTVKLNNVYVIGDKRDVPIESHDFGQTPVSRLMGVPLW